MKFLYRFLSTFLFVVLMTGSAFATFNISYDTTEEPPTFPTICNNNNMGICIAPDLSNLDVGSGFVGWQCTGCVDDSVIILPGDDIAKYVDSTTTAITLTAQFDDSDSFELKNLYFEYSETDNYTQTCYNGTSCILPTGNTLSSWIPLQSIDGKKLIAWECIRGFCDGNKYRPGEDISEYFYSFSGDELFVAVTDAVLNESFDITYDSADPNAVLLSPEPAICYHGESCIIPGSIYGPPKQKLRLNGYRCVSNTGYSPLCNGQLYQPNFDLADVVSPEETSVTLTAEWADNIPSNVYMQPGGADSDRIFYTHCRTDNDVGCVAPEAPNPDIYGSSYPFLGWLCVPDKENAYCAGRIFQPGESLVTAYGNIYDGDITLVAIWKEVLYVTEITVGSYCPSDTTCSLAYPETFYMYNCNFYYDKNLNFEMEYDTIPQVPSSSDYNFRGYTWGDKLGIDNMGSKQICDATYDYPLYLTLTPEWQAKYVTITLNKKGGTGYIEGSLGTSDATKQCTTNEPCSLPTSGLTKEGYVFNGWSYRENCTEGVTSMTFSSNSTIYACWEPEGSAMVQCQAGKYYDGSNHVTCPAGYYCPGEGEVTAGTAGCRTLCPNGYTSGGSGLTSESQCKISCAAGTQVVSANGTCTTAKGSWYTSAHTVNYGSTSGTNVKACATGYATPDTTNQTDHDNVNDCKISCAAGTQVVSANGTCTTAKGSWYTSAHTVNYGSTSGANVKACATGYATPDTTNQTDHDNVNDCKISCAAGTYISTVNASSCVNVGTGYWSTSEEVSQGETSTRNLCPEGYRDGEGTTSINLCKKDVPADNYIKSSGDKETTVCSTGYSNEAETINYGDTSECDAKTYKITLDKNGGTGDVPSSISCTYDSGICSIPETTGLTKTGYSVGISWCTNKDGGGTCYKGGENASTNISSTGTGTTLYAVWTPNVYKISIEDNGSSVSSSPKSIYIKYGTGWYRESSCTTSITALDTVARRHGYTLSGYYTLSSGGDQVITKDGLILSREDILTKFTSDSTLYAHWGQGTVQCEPGSYYSGSGTVCKECESGSYCEGGEFATDSGIEEGKTLCPNGYTSGGSGLTSESQCKISCAAGTQVVSANGTCTTAKGSWYTSAHTVKYGSTSGANVKACATGYATPDTTNQTDHDNVNDCKISCAAGTQVVSANGTCTTAKGSWYTSAHTVNYGSTSGTNVKACATGYATPDTTNQTDHDNVNDCKISCAAGTQVVSANGTCTTAKGSWYTSAHTVKYGSTSGANVKACATGYATPDTTNQTDHDNVNDCKISCAAGTYISTVNASSCVNVGTGYWSTSEEVSQGETSTRNLCPEGYRDGEGTTSINLCKKDVPADNYIKSSGDKDSTVCSTGYSNEAETINYGDTSECDAKTYKITLDKNGGTGDVPSSISCTYDSGICSIPETTGLTKTGYSVGISWCTNKDGSGTCYKGGENASTNISSTGTGTTLYAVWTPNVYKISIEDNGSSVSSSPKSIYIKYGTGWYRESSCTTSITALDTVARRHGYTLSGYYTLSSGGDQVITKDGLILSREDILTKFTSDSTLYAHWGQGTVQCEPGSYYSGSGTVCKECESGSYCEGGEFATDSGIEEGKTLCPNGGASSIGSSDIGACYIACSETIFIEHGEASSTGNKYYDGAGYPLCTYTAICEDGYRVKDNNSPNPSCERVGSIECYVPNATYAEQVYNPTKGVYSLCIVKECEDGYHIASNACVSDFQQCNIANGVGIKEWNHSKNAWGKCIATYCDPGYTNDPAETNDRIEQCGECRNKYAVRGELAASSYVEGCEIAACMYQGERYNLENNECVPICPTEEYEDETGTMVWDDVTKKCVRTCKDGYVMW